MISRVSRIQTQLIQSWDVLATMTPSDYSAIREGLGQSSGFQSSQYRLLEFMLGQKDVGMMTVHEPDPETHARLDAALCAPSLYDEVLRLLSRRGFAIPPTALDRDWSEPYESRPEVIDAWLAVYRDPTTWWDLYELAEKLVDLEYRFQQWRFSHMKTVERIIGFQDRQRRQRRRRLPRRRAEPVVLSRTVPGADPAVIAVLAAALIVLAASDPLTTRIEDSAAAAQALQGRLDGAWTLRDGAGQVPVRVPNERSA